MTRAEEHSDNDPIETREWLDSIESVLETQGPERVHFLIEQLIARAREAGVNLPYKATTAYLNTIPTEQEERIPGDLGMYLRIRAVNSWNGMAMVVRANRVTGELGGHIASFASSATLYDTGLNYFWHAPSADHGGDIIYFQGHSVPGIYARAFMEGRLSEDQLLKFRQEVDAGGLSSYPHPWLMPTFWQFPTVSMGLGR